MRVTLPLKFAPHARIQPAPVVLNDSAPANAHFLHSGQVFVSAKAEPIVLILGSCVAVCLWDAVNAIGGATHYLLPTWDGRGVPSPRYGNVAVSTLFEELANAGANRGHLRAKIFGGGCLFDSLGEAGANKEQGLGSRNVEVAVEILTKERITIVSTDVRAKRGQRIVFHPDTGEAIVKTL